MINNKLLKLKRIKSSNKWKIVKLNDIANITMGQSPLAKNYTDKKNGYLLIQGVYDFKYGRISPRLYTSQKTKESNKGNVLLTVRAPIGKAVINNKRLVMIGRGIANINSSHYNYFLYLIFSRMDYLGQWTKYSVGSGASKSIKAKTLRNIHVNIPTSLKKKHSIELLFHKLDNLIHLQIKKIIALKEAKTGWIQRIFNKRNYRLHWKKCRLTDLLIKGQIGSTPSLTNQDTHIKRLPFLTITDLNNIDNQINDTKRHISKWDVRNSNAWIVPKGAITLSIYGQIGKPLKIKKPLVTSQSFFSMIFKSTITANFMYFLFQSLKINDTWYPYINNSSTIKSIKISDVKSIIIFIPSLEIQKKIVKLLSQFDNVIYDNQNKLKLLIHLRNGYLQQILC